MLICSICGQQFDYHYSCDLSHQGVCHDCFARNLAGETLGAREHPAPRAPVVLSPADLAALVRYQGHRQRTLGTGPLRRRDLVTGEDTP